MITIRPVQEEDLPILFDLIKALAKYENLLDQVTGNLELLREHLFSTKPYIEAILAQTEQTIVGYAIYFYNYSTFLTRPGIYIEDIFVLPQYRRKGIGKALLTTIAKIALNQGCGRLEWSVLDWNKEAIAFYQQQGAILQSEWSICRVTNNALIKLGENSHDNLG